MPASRTRTRARPGRNCGSGFEVALSFLFFTRQESAGLSSSFSFYLCGIAFLPAESSGQVRPSFQSDRTWPPASPAGDRGPCSLPPNASLVSSALPSGLRSVRSFGWPNRHPAPSSLAVPVVSQNAVDVRDGFVQILANSIRGMICRLGEAAQFRLTLYRQVQVQVHRIAHFLREGFSAQLRAASEALLLCWIHMNKRCGHVGSYITPISYHGNSSVESSSKRLEQQRLLFGKNGAQVENQAIVFDARDDGDAGGGRPPAVLHRRAGDGGVGSVQ